MLLIERLGFCYVLLFFLPDFAGTVFALIAKDAACDQLVTMKHHIASPSAHKVHGGHSGCEPTGLVPGIWDFCPVRCEPRSVTNGGKSIFTFLYVYIFYIYNKIE